VLYAVKAGLNPKTQGEKIFGENGCVSAAPDWQTAPSWCAKPGRALYSAVLDPRTAMAREIADQRLRLSRTLYRLAAFYNGTRTFPTHGARKENGKLVKVEPGEKSDSELSVIADSSGLLTSGNCARDTLALYYSDKDGPTDLSGLPALPLGCEDAFDVWGKGVRYQRPTEKSVRLVVVSPYKDKDGNPILIVQEMNPGV
jgi:hypothetical protein